MPARWSAPDPVPGLPRALLAGLALLALPISCGSSASPGAPAPTFEAQWQDGKAELDGYRYEVTRYGARRAGRCVMVFVTEPFSESLLVKVDDPAKHPGDVFEALKLNVVRMFQTGLYDYHTMVSVFARTSDFSPVKVALDAAEWCGIVYEEQHFRSGALTISRRSYFEGESASRSLAVPEGGVAEDNLFILLRGLRAPYLTPGERRTVPFLPGSLHARLTHQPSEWTSAEIERARDPERLTVPAGPFRADRYTVRVRDGREGQIWVERGAPHRIVKWTWTAPPHPATRMGGDAAEQGELAGSARLPYWQLHDPGDERYLRDLGLAPLPSR